MTVDLTQIAIAVVSAVFSLAGVVATVMIPKYVNDQKAAATLNAGIQNSLGAMQQAITDGIKPAPITGVKPELVPAVRYVLDHHADEVKRFGLTPEAIAARVDAQRGLRTLAAKESASSMAVVPVSAQAAVPKPAQITAIPAYNPPMVTSAPAQLTTAMPLSGGGSSFTISGRIELASLG